MRLGFPGGLAVASVLACVVATGCSRSEAPTSVARPDALESADAESEIAATVPPSESAPRVRVREQEAVKAAFAALSPEARLGARLFFENRLSNPGANLATSCRSCHVPPAASGDQRRWTDFTPLSVIPANDRGGKLETLRNTPSLLDVSTAAPYPLDGEFDTLDAYLNHKLLSEHMGWRPGEMDRAQSEIQALLMYDDGSDPLAEGTYAEQFSAAKNIDVLGLSAPDAMAAVVAALQDYLAIIVTANTSAYDAIMYLNRFPENLAGVGDTPFDFSGRFFGRVANEEGRVLIRFPNVYDEDAYQGLKTFMRVIPTWNSSVVGEETNVGNCIACHVPPKFTDYAFHNIGVTQMEYDAVHGDGAFMNFEFESPSEKTRSRIDAADPERADLGRWNVDPNEQNLGAFKTSKLRDPAGSDPFMHNGRYATVEDAIRQHIRAAGLAREGRLRNPDPELVKISGLTEKDVAQLAAFVATLNEVDPEAYRDFRVNNVRIRQDPLGESTFEN